MAGARYSNVTLRPATPSDRAFAERVYFETQRWLIEKLFGWRGDEFERAKFADFYDEHNTDIVQSEGEDVGWVTVVREPDRIEVNCIYVTTAKQGHGLGTTLIERIITEADVTNKRVTLSTAKINPARRLYERLGFVVVDESEFKVYMERKQRKLCASVEDLHAIDIRAARRTDFDELLVLFDEVAAERQWIGTEPGFDKAKYRAAWQGILDGKGGAHFVAARGGKLLGALSLHPTADGGHDLGILVSRERRGQGIGRALMGAAIAWAQSRGAPKLSLGVFPHNETAIRLYENMGFVAVRRLERKKVRQTGDAWDLIVMEKHIHRLFDLLKPTAELADSFERMRDAVSAAGEDAWNGHGTEIAWKDVHAYIKATNDWAKGANVPHDWIPTSTYWIVENGEVVGELEVRHHLLPRLRVMGGHIGYHTHPQHRGKGIATFALEQGLRILASMGTAAALITCSDNNAASARVIEKCGGVRVQDSAVPGFEPRRRYVVPLAREHDLGEFEDLRGGAPQKTEI